MDKLTFSATVISSLAWPVLTILIAFLFRHEIVPLAKEVIKKMEKIKLGPFSAELNRRVDEARSAAEEADKKATALSQFLDEPEDSEAVRSLEQQPALSDEELGILQGMTESRYAMRSVTGVAQQLGLSKETVNLAYTQLIGKGLVEQTTNKGGQLRWYPTNLGRIVASQTSNSSPRSG